MGFKRLSVCIIFICAIQFLLISPAFSANYYVKNGGSDSADGLSDGTAWATVAHVNDCAESAGSGSCPAGFSDGDVINFNRGDTWTSDETLGKDAVGHTIVWGPITGLTFQEYGSGNLPWLNGNTQHPIFIVDSTITNLTIKNIDASGLDAPLNYRANVQVYHVNGITIDGVYVDGHQGASTYNNHPGGIGINAPHATALGDIEVKNCTVKNMYKDTFANTYTDWYKTDAPGIILYFDGGGKTSGTVSIHDNTITNVYSDGIAIEGVVSASRTQVYSNTISGYGEDAFDLKGSRYVDIYNNDISWNNFGSSPGETYWGATVLVGQPSSITGDKPVGDHTFHDNYVHDAALVSIRSGATLGLDIYNNYFKDVGMAYVAQGYARNQRFYNNLVVQTAAAGSSHAMDAWTYKSGAASGPNCSSIEIYNNTFYISSSNHRQGIYLYDGTGATVKNNIIQMIRNSADVFPLYSAGTGPTISYNAYYNANNANRAYKNGKRYYSTDQAAWISSGHTGDLFSDPMFTSAQAGDFSLRAGSPCILPNMKLGVFNLPLLASPTTNDLPPPKGLKIMIGTN